MVLPVVGKRQESAERLLVGCDDHCDVVVGEASVSRKHAWIKKMGKDYFLEDNSSTGGTFVNGCNSETDPSSHPLRGPSIGRQMAVLFQDEDADLVCLGKEPPATVPAIALL